MSNVFWNPKTKSEAFSSQPSAVSKEHRFHSKRSQEIGNQPFPQILPSMLCKRAYLDWKARYDVVTRSVRSENPTGKSFARKTEIMGQLNGSVNRMFLPILTRARRRGILLTLSHSKHQK